MPEIVIGMKSFVFLAQVIIAGAAKIIAGISVLNYNRKSYIYTRTGFTCNLLSPGRHGIMRFGAGS